MQQIWCMLSVLHTEHYSHFCEAEVHHLIEHSPIFSDPCCLVCLEKGQHCLAVNPPQLHRPFQLSGWVATNVQEVEEASVERVKAVAVWTLNELFNSNLLQLSISSAVYDGHNGIDIMIIDSKNPYNTIVVP